MSIKDWDGETWTWVGIALIYTVMLLSVIGILIAIGFWLGRNL